MCQEYVIGMSNKVKTIQLGLLPLPTHTQREHEQPAIICQAASVTR